MSLLEKAIQIAVGAHQGQKDKAGAPYILHPLRLLQSLETEDEMIAAVLHDVIEDTPVTMDQLRGAGFSEEMLEAIDCLTRCEGESYGDFVTRAKANPIARRVKIADIEDNMNLLRIEEITERDLRRLERYHRAWRVLTAAEPATPEGEVDTNMNGVVDEPGVD